MPAIRRVACAVLMLLCAASALAWGKDEVVFHPPTPQELAMTSVPSAPGAHAVILQWDQRDAHNVTLKRSFTINTVLIAKSNYDRVRGFYESSLAADQETVILKH